LAWRAAKALLKGFGEVALQVGLEGIFDGIQLSDVVVEGRMHRRETFGSCFVENFVSAFPQEKCVVLETFDEFWEKLQGTRASVFKGSSVNLGVDVAPLPTYKAAENVLPSDQFL
jgi:hypothetical protein